MSSILLDTNYLIKSLIPDSTEAEQIGAWIEKKIDLITSSICWYEFLCGPVDASGIEVMEMILQGRVIPFTGDQSREAARMFNRTGRQRSLRVDSRIAAAAILSNAALATDNNRDFSLFEELGLTLV